ncbi:hypothetical protein [Roseococcus suduntuyensis]|uniref:Uncharacterized protein n=1 Tax=Roseococcus suduntuyensis TaxID=455361 RepID=A0A840AEF0_9PROT|nr:hypothetical protein [Roseococcus suduntuyensis]MBB3899282.1 hypothetical protein [Roseococcus suduntuyensis]
MDLPAWMRFEDLSAAHPRVLSLRSTEQFLLLASYKLWREDVSPIDGAALDKLRSRLSPHPRREQNLQFGRNVLETALERLSTAGLIELGERGLTPALRAVVEIERAMGQGKRDVEPMLRRLLEG